VEDGEEDDDSEWYDSEADTEVDEDAEAETARQAELQRAAEEAQRQRDMFSKKRTPSRVELVELGRIGGGLSRLFHPDPETLRSADLYRTQSADDTMARRAAAERLKLNKSAVELRPNGDGPPAPPAPLVKKSIAPLKLSKSSAALPTRLAERRPPRCAPHWLSDTNRMRHPHSACARATRSLGTTHDLLLHRSAGWDGQDALPEAETECR
jgi:hypothetical protein